ncbi:MAG: hypothetical protein JW709_12025 [Sedimentisphaerales bacterium]|nr:hypothetical protein [Sedimentisphaerales bacterium]
MAVDALCCQRTAFNLDPMIPYPRSGYFLWPLELFLIVGPKMAQLEAKHRPSPGKTSPMFAPNIAHVLAQLGPCLALL